MKIIYDEIFLKHSNEQHVEKKDRLKLLLPELENYKVIKPTNGEDYLSLAHSNQYIELIKNLEGEGFLNPDTYYNEFTFEAACYSAGASIQAIEKQAFALTRPPGHHALQDNSMGFCIFSNMAIATKYLSNQGKKVAILDIDCHHGNGTQNAVIHDENILFCSFHQSPFYPGTGLENIDNCINIPIARGTGDEVIDKLEKEFIPKLNKFQPDYIGVSAGFDSYYKDKHPVLGNDLNITEKTFEWVADLVKSYKHFFLLEGGYQPISIKEGVLYFIENL